MDFILENGLTCLYDKFQKRKENYGPTPIQTMLKHPFEKKNWINSALNWEAYFSFEGASSDHQSAYIIAL